MNARSSSKSSHSVNKADPNLVVFWFRRDLRLEDNAGLFYALKENQSVLPIFIFDKTILQKLNNSGDRRVWFIHQQVTRLKEELRRLGCDLRVFYGEPSEIFKTLIDVIEPESTLTAVYTNHDYEPQAILRDQRIENLLKQQGVLFKTFKDQVIFEKDEVLTDARRPYTVYTPYKKKWIASLSDFYLKSYSCDMYFDHFQRTDRFSRMLTLAEMEFDENPGFEFPPIEVESRVLAEYAKKRDFPALDATSHLGLYLRFGTVAVRELVRAGLAQSEVWLSELIWREFFMQILFHFPTVEKTSFRPEYEKVKWRKNDSDFERWCMGQTGYPLVDAGMRELNQTGYMHNRVRMLVASFLTKHLLIHWLQGERYFASHLLDYELASNNGNWQWAAGTGCDAAPYFRIFNPTTQIEKFDRSQAYIKKWVPELDTKQYPTPMVDHREARERCLKAFAAALKK